MDHFDLQHRLRIWISRNNGSLPPPHRRANELVLDAAGVSHYTLFRGYDLGDRDCQFRREFVLTSTQREQLAQILIALAIFDTDWQRSDIRNVGAPQIHIHCSDGVREVEIPNAMATSQLLQRQDELVSVALAQIPTEIIAEARAWKESNRD